MQNNIFGVAYKVVSCLELIFSVAITKAVKAQKVCPRVKFPPRNTYLSHHESDHDISQNHSLLN
jgi:hypothetical protein